MKNTLTSFLRTESAGGLILMVATAFALLVANSPLSQIYTTFLHLPLFHHSLTHIVNDLLMTFFFLLVGLEIKRELLGGELATWPQRLLPGVAAIGGMVVPALIYTFINRHSPSSLSGWAIPTATDIAFALGILTLLGSRVPNSLKIFLTALAILDDLGAILLIAIFYTHGITVTPLLLAGILLASLITFNRSGITAIWPYLITGALLWICIAQSGLHPTLAGVLLSLTIPFKAPHSPLLRLEHALQPYVAFMVLPIFGFFNAGISLSGIAPETLLHPITLGITTGLFFGKQLGIGGAIWLAIRFLKATAPVGANTLQLYAVTLLCGIGFTMSLFIGNLALPPEMMPEVRLGILLASLTSTLCAVTLLSLTRRSK